MPGTDARLLVLHGLRLKGFGEPDAVAAVVNLDVAEVAAHLDVLLTDGLVLRREGPRLAGWSLTPAGRAEQERLLGGQLDAAGGREELYGAYADFLALNKELLATCTAWQMTDDTTINDHADAGYDADVIERLLRLHEQLVPILARLEAVLERYSLYGPRFEAALSRLEAGDPDWFTKPMIDSYHTIWFQLHEDLLNTLGIDRASEGEPS